MDAVAKHLCHDTITSEKMDLKTMRLLPGASFRIDAANVFF